MFEIVRARGVCLIGPVLRLYLCAAGGHEDEVFLGDAKLGGNPSFQLWQSVHVSIAQGRTRYELTLYGTLSSCPVWAE
jgi:hypothetical protein